MQSFYAMMIAVAALGTLPGEEFVHLESEEVMEIECPVEACHAISKLGYAGDWICLEDGSKWQVALGDQPGVLMWSVGDVVYITPSDSMLKAHDYLLVNYTKKTVVYANRLIKPASFGPHSKFVAAIDWEKDRILLNDGIWWSVASAQESSWLKWEENHTVIIGVNNGINHLEYPFILINVGIDVFDLGLDEWVLAKLNYDS